MAAGKHGGVEIGATFLRPDVRASPVNPEAKILMLGHAFDGGAVRVQFKVDMRTWAGHIRDTVVFSILDSEWPAVRLRLRQRLAEPTG
ncbi:hypothetical protein [Bradyrhizobium sp.]